MSAMLDYMQLCRLCLVKEKVNVPIFGDDNDVRQIFLKITACLPVKVSQEDNLPKKICDACLYKVDLLYQFWNTTVNAEKQLIQWLTEIGVEVNIKNSDTQTLPILPQSHAHPHSIPLPTTLVLKQERPDGEKPVFQIPEQPLYPGYDNLGYPQPEVTMEVGVANTFVQPEPTEEPPPLEPPAPTPKKRGRPAGATNKKPPPKKKATPAPPPPVISPRTNSTRRSSATAAAAAVAAAAAAASDSEEDSGDDHLGGMDYDDDSDSDEEHITKDEVDSDEDYIKPKAFLGVPSSADGEQPGPSGLGTIKGEPTGATESGFDVKLPEGIRIKKNTPSDEVKKPNITNKKPVNTIPPQNKTTSIYEEVMEKLNAIPSINIKKDEPIQKDMSSIVDNLTKCGLIVKKVNNDETDPLQCDDNDDGDDDNESDYEIETLDDEDDEDDEDSSDMEYVPNSSSSPSKRKGKPKKDSPKKDGTKKTEKKSKNKEFIKIQSTNYLCIMCNEKFPSFDMLTKHMTSGIPCRVVTIACPICGKEFPSRSRCSSHISSTHKEKPKYHCTKCSKFFSNPVTLQIHEELNHTEYFDATDNGFQCKMCAHQAENRRLILHHINQNHLHVSTLLCDICGKSFLNENGLRNHIQTHRETKSYLCQICSKAFKMKSSLRAHIKTHDTERSFVCDECGKSFKKKCTLSEHKKYHAGDFSFPCNWCSKKFVSRSLLNTHMKNHSA